MKVRCRPAYLSITLALLCGGRLEAQALPPPPSPETTGSAPADASSQKNGSSKLEIAPTPAEGTRTLAQIDTLGEPGLVLVYPPSSDSLLKDDGGWRSRLADDGLWVAARLSASFAYDVLQHNSPFTAQSYNGQRFTVVTASPTLVIVKTLDDIGLPNSKIIGAVNSYNTNWSPDGPSHAGLHNLYYYQSFFNKAVEIKAGFHTNYLDFVGVFTGGSPVLASGFSSLIPVEAGLSVDPVPTPTLNITVSSKGGIYFKGAVQRSTSPLGILYEGRHNGFGLKFSSPGARPLVIGETGIKRDATADKKQLWIRAGAIYNSTRYNNLLGNGKSHNYAAYLLGDYQFYQFDREQPYRGIFLGASAMFASPTVNAYSQYYELRLYALGMIVSRPNDGVTLNINRSRYSDDGRRAIFDQTSLASPAAQFVASVNYGAQITSGIYLTPSISYLHHPAYGVSLRDGLSLGLGLFLQL